MRLLIERAGLLCSVQGQPRVGFERIGVPRGGPMDPVAWQVLNVLLGQSPGHPVLELAGGHLRIQLDGDANLAVLGRGYELSIDGQPHSTGMVLSVCSGQRMDLRAAQPAGFAYVGVAGDWTLPPVLGSTSTDLRNGLGGIGGRVLSVGDQIHIDAAAPRPRSTRGIRWPMEPGSSGTWHLIVHEPALAAPLLTGVCRVGRDSNRQALLLDPERPVRHDQQQRISAPQWPGAIQSLPDGRFALLGPEAQTVGGYPLVASLISAELPMLGRCGPGASLRFAAVELAEAALRSRDHELALAAWLKHIAAQIEATP
ncbi:MAG: biotin-dependent carboxyltransferase family protein [Ahniella sp.]|nr:biotin-dependent carboxyltransferase family protein [Ahniella sp.]